MPQTPRAGGNTTKKRRGDDITTTKYLVDEDHIAGATAYQRRRGAKDAAGMASLQLAGSQSSVSIASLVELMRSEQLIPSVNHLKVQLNDGGTLSMRLDMADDGKGDACLVLKESTATIVSLLLLEKRKRKIAEALLKQKQKPTGRRGSTPRFGTAFPWGSIEVTGR